jgi:ferredoxin
MQNKTEYTINFQPIGRRVAAFSRNSLLNAAQEAGIVIASICGGMGICDSCKIRLITGSLSEPTLEEKTIFTVDELQNGYRLACQAYPQSDLTIEIPPESHRTPKIANRREDADHTD